MLFPDMNLSLKPYADIWNNKWIFAFIIIFTYILLQCHDSTAETIGQISIHNRDVIQHLWLNE